MRGAARQRWTECLGAPPSARKPASSYTVGVLPGEGIGPEVIGATLDVLAAVAKKAAVPFRITHGGSIGREAERLHATPLPQDVVEFCDGVFKQGGAILHGPGGGRFVYDLRQRFDLFFKISPLRPAYGVAEASKFKPDGLRGVDILMTRENSGGIYQGAWDPDEVTESGRIARHRFSYHEHQVRRFLEASACLAKRRPIPGRPGSCRPTARRERRRGCRMMRAARPKRRGFAVPQHRPVVSLAAKHRHHPKG